MAIVKSLVSVAWADGTYDDAEKEMVEALISAFEASEEQAKEIREYASTKRTINDVPVDDLSDDDCRVLLQHAVLLSYVDGTQHESEKTLIHDMAKKFGIPDDESHSLIELAENRAKRFLNLL
ncbi:MAG: TerB family tellurite resistance protein [Polyangiaceae bacterium]|nr:TerB family tellurite resistance protein [Polyangiaceae bacterium]